MSLFCVKIGEMTATGFGRFHVESPLYIIVVKVITCIRLGIVVLACFVFLRSIDCVWHHGCVTRASQQHGTGTNIWKNRIEGPHGVVEKKRLLPDAGAGRPPWRTDLIRQNGPAIVGENSSEEAVGNWLQLPPSDLHFVLNCPKWLPCDGWPAWRPGGLLLAPQIVVAGHYSGVLQTSIGQTLIIVFK